MPKKPHIIIFNPDQWRGDVMGHMDNPAAHTPNYDKAIADDHVSFRRAFCQNPVCTPSRCSFMSGWYPHVTGHRTMYHMLRKHEPVLLKTLRDNGYFVWWGGKNDLVPGQEGFDDFCDIKYQPREKVDPIWRPLDGRDFRGAPGSDTYYSFYRGKLDHSEGKDYFHDGDWAMMLGAIDFIKNYDGDKPLCIYLPLTYPHPPYAVEEPWYGITDRDAIPERTPAPEDWDAAKKPSILKGISETQNMRGWSEERWKELRGVYYGMCSRIDHQYGLLVDALKESGIYDDSAVFSFADHGDFTGDFGIVEKTQNTFEDCLTRVPFVIKPPKDVPVKARVSDAMVELIDFPATVEALTGITPNHTHFGKSLLPLVAGETDEHRDAVFCEGGRLKEEIHCSEINSNPNLNPEHEYYPRLAQQLLNGPQHTKATMCRTKDWKYTRRLYESDELYDLKNDPRETVNLIDDPNCAGILAELKERMLRFYHETSDVVPYDSDWR